MAQIQIFSKTWFDMLLQANDKIGELYLSPAMRDIRLNILITPNIEEQPKVETDETIKNTKEEPQENAHQLTETIQLKLLEGCLYKDKGVAEDIKSTISLSYTTMKKLLTELNMDVVMQAFINGEITVIGDVSQLMALQMTKPSEEQKALFMTILENTKL